MAKEKTKTFSVRLGPELIKEVDSLVYWTPGVTVSSFVSTALRDGMLKLKLEGPGPFLADPKREKPN